MKQVFAATAAFALLRLGSLAQANTTIETIPVGGVRGGSFHIIHNDLQASNRAIDYSPTSESSGYVGFPVSQVVPEEPSLPVLLGGIGGLMWRRWR